MVLLLTALFGLLVPNGIFIYWLFSDYKGFSDVINNKLALAFIIEAFLVMFLFAYYFSRNPPGRFKWQWFVAFSLIGSIGFAIPFYWWLNRQKI